MDALRKVRLLADPSSACDEIDRLEALVVLQRHERDREAARAKFLGDYLARIHGYLYPPVMTVDDRTYAFQPPNPHEYMQKLSDAIRAIPDQIVAANRG